MHSWGRSLLHFKKQIQGEANKSTQGPLSLDFLERTDQILFAVVPQADEHYHAHILCNQDCLVLQEAIMEKTCARNPHIGCHIHHCTDLNRCRAFKASLEPPIIIEQIKIRLAVPRNPDQLILPYFLRDRVSRGALPFRGDNFRAFPLSRNLGERLHAAQQL